MPALDSEQTLQALLQEKHEMGKRLIRLRIQIADMRREIRRLEAWIDAKLRDEA